MAARKKNHELDRRIKQLQPTVKSVAAFCRLYDLDYQRVNNLLCMRDTPFNAAGFYTPLARQLAGVLDCWCVEIFPPAIYGEYLAQKELPAGTSLARAAEMDTTPFDVVFFREQRHSIWRILEEHLPARHAYFLDLHFGLSSGGEEKNLAEIAHVMGISKDRARGLKGEVFRKVRLLAFRSEHILPPELYQG